MKLPGMSFCRHLASETKLRQIKQAFANFQWDNGNIEHYSLSIKMMSGCLLPFLILGWEHIEQPSDCSKRKCIAAIAKG